MFKVFESSLTFRILWTVFHLPLTFLGSICEYCDKYSVINIATVLYYEFSLSKHPTVLIQIDKSVRTMVLRKISISLFNNQASISRKPEIQTAIFSVSTHIRFCYLIHIRVN